MRSEIGGTRRKGQNLASAGITYYITKYHHPTKHTHTHLSLEQEHGKELVLEQRIGVGHFMNTYSPAAITYKTQPSASGGVKGHLCGDHLTISAGHVTGDSAYGVVKEGWRVLERGGEGAVFWLYVREPGGLNCTHPSHVQFISFSNLLENHKVWSIVEQHARGMHVHRVCTQHALERGKRRERV